MIMENENLNLENQELDALLDRGVSFKIGKRNFTITRPFAGTLDILSSLYLKIAISDSELDNMDQYGANTFIKATVKVWAMIAAVAVLNSRWKIKLLAPILAKYFYWNMKVKDLEGLAKIIIEMNSTVDFIISTKLIAGVRRTTQPNLVEQSKQA